MNKSTIEQ